MKSKSLLILFIADVIIDSAFLYFQKHEWRYATKPLLIILLSLYSIVEIKKKSTLFFLLLTSLSFSLAGDVFLILKDISFWFIPGLIGFLIAHVFYITIFLRIKKQNQPTKKLNLIASLFIAAYTIATFLLLRPFLGNLLAPVLIYTLVILTMFLTSVQAFDFREQVFGKLCIIGAAIFIISDSLLAANKFYHPFAGAGILVMLTYTLAQLMIVVGITGYLNSVNND